MGLRLCGYKCVNDGHKSSLTPLAPGLPRLPGLPNNNSVWRWRVVNMFTVVIPYSVRSTEAGLRRPEISGIRARRFCRRRGRWSRHLYNARGAGSFACRRASAYLRWKIAGCRGVPGRTRRVGSGCPEGPRFGSTDGPGGTACPIWLESGRRGRAKGRGRNPAR